MNERIKTMWEESTGSMWPRPGKFTAGEYDIHLEKFAELIVQECAGIYDKIDNGNLHMGTDDYLEALHKTFRS